MIEFIVSSLTNKALQNSEFELKYTNRDFFVLSPA